MRGENEHAGREIFRGPDEAAHADALWRAQRQLAAAGSRAAMTLAAEVAAGQAALGGRVFRILSPALGPLRERIERLDRRARRLGTAPIGCG